MKTNKFQIFMRIFHKKYRVIEKSIIFQKIDLQEKLILFIENFNIPEIQFLKDFVKAEEREV
jgi:hypothetical protein